MGPQNSTYSLDYTDSDVSDGAMAEETLGLDSDNISQHRYASESPQIPRSTSNALSLSNNDFACKKLTKTACTNDQENEKNKMKTPKGLKLSKTRSTPSTKKIARRERSVSPVESIASSRGRRNLAQKKINFEANLDDGSDTDDFFNDETLSDFQPNSDSDKNTRNSTASKKNLNHQKKAKISDSDSEENDHQNSKDIS